MYKIISNATSANIGPGFDCLGICFNVGNTIRVEEYDDCVIINHHADTVRNKNNLIVKSMYQAADIIGYNLKGVNLEVKTNIPLSRGLGSSASCIAAGVAATFLLSGNVPVKSDIFEIATNIEGHPDNVAANIFGGLNLAYQQGDKHRCIQYQIDKKFRFIAIVPNFSLSTVKAREVLPDKYGREDVVYNIAKVSTLITALQLGNSKLLADSLDDKLHQPYRKELISDYDQIVEIAKSCGAVGTYISGAGPTIMAIADSSDVLGKIQAKIDAEQPNWSATDMSVSYEGIECFKIK